MTIQQHLLNSHWQVCATWENEWHLAQPIVDGGNNLRRITPWIPALVPGVVQDDALRAGLIPDPYQERNSLACEWTSHRDWVYRRFFPPDTVPHGSFCRILFRGVDDHCSLSWDGRPILHHRGPNQAFYAYLPQPLNSREGHWLHVLVHSAPSEVGQLGRTTETETRKTRFAYKWDFSTCLVPLGIWKPVVLETSTDGWFVDHPVVRCSVDPHGAHGHVSLHTNLHLHPAAPLPAEPAHLHFQFSAPDGKPLTRQNIHCPTPTQAEFTFDLPKPDLWFPHTHGPSPLYALELSAPPTTPDSPTGTPWRYRLNTGFQHVALENNPGAPDDALPYTFVVNHRPLYICGANWVPADQLYGRTSPDRYRNILDMARHAGINLLRVWGGGALEQDAFYQHCSRLGLLVWHDFFLSSSGIDNEPVQDPQALEELADESSAVVRELSRYACLANWCGGNELMDCGTSTPCTSQGSPAIHILEHLSHALDPSRPFLPTTPSGPNFGLSLEAISTSQRIDDAHGPWTFQGPVDHFLVHNGNSALFHSEYGVEGPPELESLLEISPIENLWPTDRSNPVWDFHAAWWNNQDRVEAVFGPVSSLSHYLAGAWYLQFSGLRYATEANRRRRPHCSGSIVWQLNEPWPNACCTNLIDYFIRPKPGLSALRKAYAPTVATARMSAWSGKQPGQPPEITLFFDRFENSPANDHLLIASLHAADGTTLHQQTCELPDSLNGALGSFQPPRPLPPGVCLLRLSLPQSGFINDYLVGIAGQPPLAPIAQMAQTRLAVTTPAPTRLLLRNESSTIAFGVHLTAIPNNPRLPWPLLSDNHFSLLPGETREVTSPIPLDGTIKIQGLNIYPMVA